MQRSRLRWWGAVCGSTLIGSLVGPAVALGSADRYGGVWHPGTNEGAFIPAELGMTLDDVQKARDLDLFEGQRLQDFEIRASGCPSADKDLIATQWRKGDWKDELLVLDDFDAFEDAIVDRCDQGLVLADVELMGAECEGESTAYVALFRESDECPAGDKPLAVWTAMSATESAFDAFATLGWTAVDIELEVADAPSEVLTVWYPWKSEQKLAIQDRYDFEKTMGTETDITLVDMESYRIPYPDPEEPVGRQVVFLRERFGNDKDDHEIGEVLAKFTTLGDSSQQVQADFEIHPDTNDQRFIRTLEGWLPKLGPGWSFSVRQGGEVVADGSWGFARTFIQFIDPGVVMKPTTRGPVASITKFITTLGVLRLAEQQPDPDAWLDEPFVDHLPPDFVTFGAGVETVTIRQMLRQRTGLADFAPVSSVWTDPEGWRQDMRDWLAQPLADPTMSFNYLNAHFEVLVVMMDEVELPALVPTATPWETWIDEEVFASADVGPPQCGPTNIDALAYPFNGGPGIDFHPPGWPCNGNGTGVGMFWLSADEISKLADATRNGDVVEPARFSQMLAQNQGLDGQVDDEDPTTLGEVLERKRGGYCDTTSNGPAASEALIAFLDDTNIDDVGPNGVQFDDPFEVGYRDLSVGMTLHKSRFSQVCFQEPTVFPTLTQMLVSAWVLPEDW